MDLKHHPMWLLPDGTDIPCPNWDHAREASAVFRNSRDPEHAAMAAGWLKVFKDGFEIGCRLTHAQRQTLERWHNDADAIEEDALGRFRFHARIESERSGA